MIHLVLGHRREQIVFLEELHVTVAGRCRVKTVVKARPNPQRCGNRMANDLRVANRPWCQRCSQSNNDKDALKSLCSHHRSGGTGRVVPAADPCHRQMDYAKQRSCQQPGRSDITRSPDSDTRSDRQPGSLARLPCTLRRLGLARAEQRPSGGEFRHQNQTDQQRRREQRFAEHQRAEPDKRRRHRCQKRCEQSRFLIDQQRSQKMHQPAGRSPDAGLQQPNRQQPRSTELDRGR